MDEWITADDAAKYAKASPRTIRNAMQMGYLKSKPFGKRKVTTYQWVDEWKASPYHRESRS